MGGPEPPGHLKSIYLGKHHIKNDHVVLAGKGIVQTARPVIDHVRLITLFGHDLAQRLGQMTLVLYDQNSHAPPAFLSQGYRRKLKFV